MESSPLTQSHSLLNHMSLPELITALMLIAVIQSSMFFASFPCLGRGHSPHVGCISSFLPNVLPLQAYFLLPLPTLETVVREGSLGKEEEHGKR